MIKTLKIIAFIFSISYLTLFITKFVYQPILSEKIEGFAVLIIIILVLVIAVSEKLSKKRQSIKRFATSRGVLCFLFILIMTDPISN
ncbi:hypothetical protein BU027_00220 [Staphylococcus simulans]|nr:hypothetical protein BU027_00220 [Staphylococcus simulans]